MKDYTELFEKLKKMTPYATVFLKSKGIDLNTINALNSIDKEKIDEIFKMFNEQFKTTTDQFKTTAKSTSDIIEFHSVNDDGIYDVTVKLPGYNKTNTSIEQVNSNIKIYAGQREFNFNIIDEDDEIVSTKMADGILTFSIQSKKMKNKVNKIIID